MSLTCHCGKVYGTIEGLARCYAKHKPPELDAELQAALRDLVAAHLAHKKASQDFLALTAIGKDMTDEEVTRALNRAQLRVGEEGSNVAILAMQRGIKPGEDAP